MYMLEKHYREMSDRIDMSQVLCVNISNAAEWFYSDAKNIKRIKTDDGERLIEWEWNEDFPTCVPPFQSTWFEFKIPKFIRDMWHIGAEWDDDSSNVYPPLFLGQASSVGCLATRTLEDNGWCIVWDFFIEVTEESRANANRRVLCFPDSPQFVSRSDIAIVEKRPAFVMSIVGHTDTNGVLIKELTVYKDVHAFDSYSEDERYPMLMAIKHASDIPLEELDNYVISTAECLDGETSYYDALWHPVLFATSLMHAKNVELVDSPLPTKVAKRRQKDNKPIIVFKTLNIKSIRKQSEETVNNTSVSSKQAMHLVRGHFKDYRNGGGLFGKYQGLYWWDMHVAGSDKDRAVIKDYKIVR